MSVQTPDVKTEAELKRQRDEMQDYLGLTEAMALTAGADDYSAKMNGGDFVVGFNARESTDAVVAAFDRLERAVQIARAVYQENPSHAIPHEMPDEGTMCAMQAIAHAVNMVPR